MTRKDIETKKAAIIANVIIILFTVVTFYILISYIILSKGFVNLFSSLIYLVITFIISIPIHELGHLVFGLHSGYRFTSFQFLFFKWYRREGKIHFKLEKSPLLGQCLMTLNPEQKATIKFKSYLLGGGIFNIFAYALALAISLTLYFTRGKISCFFIILSYMNLYLAISNLIPMNLKGIYNDALNVKLMKKYDMVRTTVLNTLLIEEAVENAKSIDDIPLDLLNNSGLITPPFYIHDYPFVYLRTVRALIKKEDNPFREIVLKEAEMQSYPKMYQDENTKIFTFKRLVNNEEFEYLFKMKANKNFLGTKKPIDYVTSLDYILADYRRGKINAEDAITKLETINDKKSLAANCIDESFYLELKELGIRYIKGEYPLKEETIEHESEPQPGTSEAVLP